MKNTRTKSGINSVDIGFIGIGTMGRGMVENLLKNGFNVYAYNRTQAKIKGINHANFKAVGKPKELPEKCDVIFTCVSNDEALKDILFSENGVFKALNKKNILIDCGTTSLELTSKIHQKSKEKNAEFLDAPLTGSRIGAETGQLVIMAGGKKEIFEKCMPLWNAVGKKAVYCGSSGAGQKVKHALNLAMSLILESYLEALIFAMKSGVDIRPIIEVLDNSGAKNGVASFKMPYILERSFKPAHFLYSLMHKDIKIAEKEINGLGLNLPLSKEIFKIFQKGHEKGLGEEDFCSLVKLLEGEAGIQIKK